MGMKIALIVFLLVGFCTYAAPAWAAASNPVLPPQEVVGDIRALDRPGCRVVMEDRSLEVFATDPRQLERLADVEANATRAPASSLSEGHALSVEIISWPGQARDLSQRAVK